MHLLLTATIAAKTDSQIARTEVLERVPERIVSFMVIHEYLRDGGGVGWGKGGFQGHILVCPSMSINISKIYD